VVETTLACNYYGTLQMITTILPHIRAGGRVVNVSSMVGHLNKYSDTIAHRFRSANRVADVTALMQEFAAAVRDGRQTEAGWPSAAYASSKSGVTGMTRALAKEIERGELKANDGVLVNCCCPGFINTDMTKGRARKTPDEGAQTPVMLALQDLHGKKGEFWEHQEVSQW
jgi:carbonyl reductase 1